MMLQLYCGRICTFNTEIIRLCLSRLILVFMLFYTLGFVSSQFVPVF